MRVSRLIPLFLAVLAIPASATWNFGQRIAVTEAELPGVYHHLDSAGRRNIALGDTVIGVVWEDNRSGQPGIYFSSKHPESSVFSAPIRVSHGNEAFEPAIAALGNSIFILVWEQDGAVWARTVAESSLGAALKLSSGPAGHASVATRHGEAFAVWREQQATHPGLRFARLTHTHTGKLLIHESWPIEQEFAAAPQLYPSIVAGTEGVLIAWEDRRAGHTRLLFSYSSDGERFLPPAELNEYVHNRNEYDKGNGVARVALAGFGDNEVLAAWMDKRRGGKGYGIFAALGLEGGRRFGPNERVHGEQGDDVPHHNPSVAGNIKGSFAVAWDDYRNGTSDIWLSTYTDDLEWGDDFTPSVASGEGEQSNPSIAMAADGTLHLVWIERIAVGQSTRIWYTQGTPLSD